MWKSKKEIVDTYLAHLESVAESGLGHESSGEEILTAMTKETAEFESEETPNFTELPE